MIEEGGGYVRNKQSIKLFLILILCPVYIFSFSHFGAYAYDALLNKNNSFDEGTMIGNVDISGETKAEASTLLNEKWTKWQNETQITVHYKEKAEVFDNSLFTLMEEESFTGIKQGGSNDLIVDLEALETFLTFMSPTLTNDVDIEKLKSDLLVNAKSLKVEG